MIFRRNTISLIKYLLLLLGTFFMMIFLYSELWKSEGLHETTKTISKKKEVLDSLRRVDWHNYTQIAEEAQRKGPGEQGSGVTLSKSQDAEKEKIYKQNGFNGLASDQMSLYRSLKDIRHPDCKSELYQATLPSVSLIIPFFEEHWSTLLRTFISALNRAPKNLIKEVILVDDASTKEFLKEKLDKYINENYKGVVKVIREKKREGLIRTRITGAKQATGDVLIFLDSHCEANVNWLPPLLDPIAKNYRTVVCPFIDVLEHDTFLYRAQDEGGRGAFDWEFFYKRLPLLPEDLERPSKPFKSPVMAGGLFAISRAWFWELGGYDPGLDIWGGEQYELSFKIWQCGGTMVDAPCSRIGHVYRHYSPFPAVVGVGNFMARNHRRVAEVWMDEYKQFLYNRQPEWLNVDTGNLTAQHAIRKRLKCKSFKWFMTNIAFDLEKYYPSVEPPSSAEGEIRSSVKNSAGEYLCIDALVTSTEKKLRLIPCLSDKANGKANQQYFELTWHEDIRIKGGTECIDVPNSNDKGPAILYPCHGQKGNQLWKYLIKKNYQLYHAISGKCLTADGPTGSIYVDTCSSFKYNQKWMIPNIKEDVIERYNLNMGISF